MPNPISHIVYADKILKNKLQDRKVDEREYFIGASFPDIRYFLKVQKEATHTNITEPEYFWDQIQKEYDSFELGILVHIYTDHLWVRHWADFLDKCPDFYYPSLLLADRLLFEDFGDMKKEIHKYFTQDILDKEIGKFNATSEIVKEWHQFIK